MAGRYRKEPDRVSSGAIKDVSLDRYEPRRSCVGSSGLPLWVLVSPGPIGWLLRRIVLWSLLIELAVVLVVGVD